MENHKNLERVSAGGLLVAMGIIFGDIGTSPLYVLRAIASTEAISGELVLGALSCIFWTLTLQTTVKYVILILRADNNGEGGIFALFALVRRHARWLTIPAIIGGSTLLSDSIITPPISVSSAVEGLRTIYPSIETIPIVLAILTVLFTIQIFGTNRVGAAFGPVMLAWFVMLGTVGGLSLMHDPGVLRALSPHYAYRLLVLHPGGFWLLGAVFLCTTGAEALYSDLGHCGRGNIRVSWAFVKVCLLLNYFGQGAYVLRFSGQMLAERNPFYEIMPLWFLPFGIGLATVATVIASQAMLSGAFTLISEAIRLNFWPKVRLVYPSDQKGQLYVPSINILLFAGCVGVVLYFKESSRMEAAYGLAITMTMMMNTILFGYYLYVKKVGMVWVVAFVGFYMLVEGAFLIANMVKFTHGGWVTVLIAGVMGSVMLVWLRAFSIKLRLTEFARIKDYLPALHELSNDISIPKYATHLVYMSNASRPSEIETKVVYSIFQKRPKRADLYWFVHVDTLDDPYTMEYQVDVLKENDVVKVTFRLGFRIEQKINLYFRRVIEDMARNGELDISSRYESLSRENMTGDFRFVVLERFLSYENDLPLLEQIVMKAYFFIKEFTTSEDKWFGLDSSSVEVEKVPLVIRPTEKVRLKRIYR